MYLIRCGAAGLLGAALSVAALSDLAWRVIPNGCVAAVALSWLLACGTGERVAEGLGTGALGAVAVLVAMLGTARLSLVLGRAAGVGGGDVKLLAAAGLWAGPVWGLVLVGASCALGLLAHGVAWATGRALGLGTRRRPGIPLGPSIAACLLAFVLGPWANLG